MVRLERSDPASIGRSAEAIGVEDIVSRSRTTVGVVLLAAAAAAWSIGTFAQGRTGTSPDISGYWELPLDGKHIPRARLTSRITPTILQAQAQKDAKAIRWCNWIGMPTTMDTGRPLDIRQGAR